MSRKVRDDTLALFYGNLQVHINGSAGHFEEQLKWIKHIGKQNAACLRVIKVLPVHNIDDLENKELYENYGHNIEHDKKIKCDIQKYAAALKKLGIAVGPPGSGPAVEFVGLPHFLAMKWL